MKKILSLTVAALVLASGAFAADLSVDAKFDLTGKDIAGSYLTFAGKLISVEKAQVDPAKADAISGASIMEATEMWNMYRPDVKGATTFPGGIQHLVKYAVSAIAQYNADLPKAWKNADGTITIQYLHRGTAFKLTTDKDGKLQLPVGDYKLRKIGNAPAEGQINSVISKDFSKDGTVAGIDWAKVWDPAVADGTVIAAGNSGKTGKITDDKGASTMYLWTGALQLTLNGTVLTVKGDLTARAPWALAK
jgi:hypothetical protein